MPKIQISTPNFVPLGFTEDFLSFKGSFAHGWFENNRMDVKNFYLHQKSLYFKLGKPDWKFHFYGGFNHQVQWGGELLYPDPKNQFSINGKVGSSFNDYLNIVTGRSLAGASDTTKNGSNDALNRSGNHLGTIDVGFEITANDFSVLYYRQNIYEDGSLAYLSNISDGLNGISINIKKKSEARIRLHKIVLEYLNTTSQGGVGGSDNTDSRLRGQDNYFNNSVYRGGWSYNQASIGTAFMNNGKEITTSNIFFTNNKVHVFYLGILGQVDKNVKTEIKLSYYTNNGSYSEFFINFKEQLSGQLKLIKPLNNYNNTIAFINLSLDSGILFNSSLGAYIGIKKEW
jgi:hypothetical protein